MKLKSKRPPESERLFRNAAVDALIETINDAIRDPDIRLMFDQCFPYSLDRATDFRRDKAGNPDTTVITGDIPALWLRDSANQVLPYLPVALRDVQMHEMIRGLIRRQVDCILLDPYANAFKSGDQEKSAKKSDQARGRFWKSGIWERKYELDSLAAFLRLSAAYPHCNPDQTPFDGRWIQAVEKVLKVLQNEQSQISRKTVKKHFRAVGRDGWPSPTVRMCGFGSPNKHTGLVRTVFRPSDDEAVFPYSIPANAMICTALSALIARLHEIDQKGMANLCRSCIRIRSEIASGIESYGIVHHPEFGDILAYEIDGFGSSCLMDDPNVPSLLSLPYLGYGYILDSVYAATRKFILSEWNPYYIRGKIASGLSSPHTGVLSHFWPMGTIMQAMTAKDEEEILKCLGVLKRTHAGTHLIHESVHVDNPRNYTRPGFGWANSLFGELIVQLYVTRRNILAEKIR
ncbi:MAG: uncharacterized protein QOG91_236 [Candidatus Parcubacteria bacterium]|jgi:meiotically up-regulated gene 157 (Mug157) protein|nr:uncharacterized protein [Candidatus Parcubacteria bacterium]